MYDLLLKGGTLVDPSQDLRGRQDVAIRDGNIAAIQAGIPNEDAARVIDVSGKIVAPGLIDLHTHVLDSFTRIGVQADLGGVYAGVTTMVDAGSAAARPSPPCRGTSSPTAIPRSSR